MLIKVTNQDIESGIMFSASWCPIARAIRRARMSDRHVSIQLVRKTILLSDEFGRTYRIKFPSKALKAAKHFDATGEMKPFEFLLNMRGVK